MPANTLKNVLTSSVAPWKIAVTTASISLLSTAPAKVSLSVDGYVTFLNDLLKSYPRNGRGKKVLALCFDEQDHGFMLPPEKA